MCVQSPASHAGTGVKGPRLGSRGAPGPARNAHTRGGGSVSPCWLWVLLAAPRMLKPLITHPQGKLPGGASWRGEVGEGRRERLGPGLTARRAPGRMPATPNASRVLCRPQYGATLQPWRLQPGNPRGQHGQQHRQPPPQGQGVQPAPQPSAHCELTSRPVGTRLRCRSTATEKRADTQESDLLPALPPGGAEAGAGALLVLPSSPDSWDREAAKMPEAWLETSARDPRRGWSGRWSRS